MNRVRSKSKMITAIILWKGYGHRRSKREGREQLKILSKSTITNMFNGSASIYGKKR